MDEGLALKKIIGYYVINTILSALGYYFLWGLGCGTLPKLSIFNGLAGDPCDLPEVRGVIGGILWPVANCFSIYYFVTVPQLYDPNFLPLVIPAMFCFFGLLLFILVQGFVKKSVQRNRNRKAEKQRIEREKNLRIDQFRDFIEKSDRFNIYDLQKKLNISNDEFWDWLANQGETSGCRIDGKMLVIPEKSKQAFISALDDQFYAWKNTEKFKLSKI